MATIVLLSATAWAEQQFTIVDSISLKNWGNTFLSLDWSPQIDGKDKLQLSGEIWNQEFSGRGFQHVNISIADAAIREVNLEGDTYQIGDLIYLVSKRKFPAGHKDINRASMVSKDGKYFLSISDDLAPAIVIGGVLAASAVAICATKTIYDMITCEGTSELEIGFKNGFTCKSTCKK